MNTSNARNGRYDFGHSIKWFKNGQLHREDGPASTSASGSEFWYQDGKLHRDDGPAITWASGTKEWYLNGKRHRTDGPAVITTHGVHHWYIDGQRIRSTDQFRKLATMLTEEEIIIVLLKFGNIR